jgi:hypothetical protein
MVVIEFHHGLKALFLKGHNLGCVRGKVSLICWHVASVHIDGQSNIAYPGKVFGNVHIEPFQTLIIVNNQDQWPLPRSVAGRNHMAQKLVTTKFNADAFAAQALILRPQLGICLHTLPPLSILLLFTRKDNAVVSAIQHEQRS